MAFHAAHAMRLTRGCVACSTDAGVPSTTRGVAVSVGSQSIASRRVAGSSSRANFQICADSRGRYLRGQIQRNVRAKASEDDGIVEDPEEKYNRFGKESGKNDKKESFLDQFPQIRRRTIATRKEEQLAELAMVNERLSGGDQAYKARQRLNYLQMRRDNWKAIYETITENDAAATLEQIEDANKKVQDAMEERSRDKQTVASMRAQMEELQREVAVAHSQLHVTEAQIAQNVARITALRAEAEALALCSTDTSCDVDAVPFAEQVAPIYQDRVAQGEPLSRPQVTGGAESSLRLDGSLKSFWFPVEFSANLKPDTLIPLELFGVPWVLFRDKDGMASCVADECAHRACPLSLGKVVDGEVECAYHGWTFDRAGACNKMPSTPFCKGVGVRALSCEEVDGFVWVWPGEGEPSTEVPKHMHPPPGYKTHTDLVLEVPVEHGLLVENMLDMAHAPFAGSPAAKNWSIPDMVRFKTNGPLGGSWDPYPIDMSFEAPCITISNIGLANQGQAEAARAPQECPKHLWQMHVCLPAKEGHTRLLYRMAFDFTPWLSAVPVVGSLWTQIANQAMGEDLQMILGQQKNLQAGADTWGNPIEYDKLAVRYRRWRSTVANGVVPSRRIAMTAAELFAEDEDRG